MPTCGLNCSGSSRGPVCSDGPPKLFQNLRSTRETKLAEDFPMHVVCQWIGNSQPIAAKHYLQVTDDHFSKAVRNSVPQLAVLPRTGSQPELAAQENTPVLQGSAGGCDLAAVAGVPGLVQHGLGLGRLGLVEWNSPTTPNQLPDEVADDYQADQWRVV
jgi:hypothetical protein